MVVVTRLVIRRSLLIRLLVLVRRRRRRLFRIPRLRSRRIVRVLRRLLWLLRGIFIRIIFGLIIMLNWTILLLFRRIWRRRISRLVRLLIIWIRRRRFILVTLSLLVLIVLIIRLLLRLLLRRIRLLIVLCLGRVRLLILIGSGLPVRLIRVRCRTRFPLCLVILRWWSLRRWLLVLILVVPRILIIPMFLRRRLLFLRLRRRVVKVLIIRLLSLKVCLSRFVGTCRLKRLLTRLLFLLVLSLLVLMVVRLVSRLCRLVVWRLLLVIFIGILRIRVRFVWCRNGVATRVRRFLLRVLRVLRVVWNLVRWVLLVQFRRTRLGLVSFLWVSFLRPIMIRRISLVSRVVVLDFELEAPPTSTLKASYHRRPGGVFKFKNT